MIGLLVGLITFMILYSERRNDDTGFMIGLCIGSLAQGFIIFALFNAIALIIENLVGIRVSLNRRDKPLESSKPVLSATD